MACRPPGPYLSLLVALAVSAPALARGSRVSAGRLGGTGMAASGEIAASGSERESLVLLLVGLPGVGKSTLCEQLRAEFEALDLHVRTFSFDEEEDRVLVESGAAGAKPPTFDPDAWRRARRNVYERVASEVPNASARSVLLLDDNFYLRSMRKPYFALARERGLSYVQLAVRCADFRGRNAARAGRARVPDFVLEHMEEVMEWPPLDEELAESASAASWERWACSMGVESVTGGHYVFRSQSVTPAGLAAAVLDERAVPAPLDEEPAPQAQPLSHEVEIQCRRVVTRALASLPPSQKQVLAKRFSSLKKDFIARALPKDRDSNAGEPPSAEELAAAFLELCRREALDVSERGS